MTTPADFYGVPLEGVVKQVDTITLTGSPSALSKVGIVSYPALETAGASPTADVITVYDVTASIALVLNTDYTLTASGSAPESQTFSVTRISSSPNSTSGDTCTVTYRWGTVPDTSYNFGGFQGETGAAPAGTQFQAGNTDTEGASAGGLGSAAGYGSLTDPAAGAQSSSETGAPGSEYAVNEVEPGTFGWPSGSPDTNPVYGGGLPESFTPATSYYSSTLDTTIGGGSDLVPNLGTPPGYRAPTTGVAANTKDTTLTDILGNQVNATPATDVAQYASQIDTGYIGSPAAPTALVSQTDTFAAAQPATRYYLSQQGLIPSSIVIKDTTTPATLVLSTDYAVTTAGNGATTASYIVLTAGTNFTAGDNISVTYNYGDATYWDSNAPTAVPGAPSITAATAVNRGAQVTWTPPSGTIPITYYVLQAEDTGTMFVPCTGQPVLDGQPSPSGGASVGQPAYQADTLTLVSAALSPPSAPSPTKADSGGTIAAGVYKVAVTYVSSNGETVASAQGSVTTTTAVSTITVPSPGAETGATGWYAYVTQVGGTTLTRQQALGSPTAIGTGLTLTAPPTSTGANPPAVNSTLPTTSKAGVITPAGQLIVRDVTSAENDPMQPGGTVLEQGYDYTVTTIGTGPWTQYQINLVASSVNAQAGDSIIVEYWWGADPSSVSAIFTQGLTPNTPVIYKPDGSTYSSHGYRFRVAAGNQIGLGPYSAYSAYVVPLNYNEDQPGHEGSTQTELALDPANTVNPIYNPAGAVKSGTGLGG